MSRPKYIDDWFKAEPDLGMLIVSMYGESSFKCRKELEWMWDNNIHRFSFPANDLIMDDILDGEVDWREHIIFEDDADATAFKLMWK